MEADTAEPIRATECGACGHLTLLSSVRCRRCGAANLHPVVLRGRGIVDGATRTESGSFAIVRLESGLQLLAFGEGRPRLDVGDPVLVSEHGDGTYDLFAAGGGGV